MVLVGLALVGGDTAVLVWSGLGAGFRWDLDEEGPCQRRVQDGATVPRQRVHEPLGVGACGMCRTARGRRRVSSWRERPGTVSRHKTRGLDDVRWYTGRRGVTGKRKVVPTEALPGAGGGRVVVGRVRRERRLLVRLILRRQAVLGGGGRSRRPGGERVVGRVVECLERELRHGPLCAALRADLATNR